MKLISTLLAGVMAASLVVPAFANDAAEPTRLSLFTAQDAQLLFEQDAMPMQFESLSQLEMTETKGAMLPYVMRGLFMGTIAGAGNVWNSYESGDKGWQLAQAFGIGFVVGSTGGVASKWLGVRGW